MHSVKKITVGVEMPETRPWNAANIAAPSRLAVRQAFGVAEAMGVAVTLVSVLPEISYGFFGSDEAVENQAEQDRTEAAAVLEDLKQQYSEKSNRPLEVTTTVAFGRPWFQILKAAGTARDNLIVCGTRHKGAVSRLLFGSTGLKLLRNAVGPVWLVNPRIDDDADLDVLAATDLTDVGEDVLATAVALGQALPVRLNVLHVIDNEFDSQMAHTGVSAEELAGYRQKAKSDGEDKLHEQLSATDYRTVPLGVQAHIAEGPPDACILSAIEEMDIDLLIMATSGRGGIPGMLFGNTAERLLPELTCSLLAIKPDDFQCPISLD